MVTGFVMGKSENSGFFRNYCIVCSDDDHMLTLNNLMTMPDYVSYAFKWRKNLEEETIK